MTTERVVRAGGVRTRVIEEGSGPPVLLVHGVGGFAENWRPTLPAVAQAGFHAMACDLPGFGQSARPGRVGYFDFPEPYYARFVRDLLDALELPRVDLVGHSLGGAIAAVSAVCDPSRVRRLVLASPGGFGAELPVTYRLVTLRLAELFAPLAPASFVRAIVRSNFHDPRRVPGWLYEDALRYTRDGGGREFCAVLRHVAALGGVRAELRHRWWERAGSVETPTLMVWGREDAIVPIAHAATARGVLPRARLEIVEDAGHLLMVERPEEFNRILLAFLSS